MTSGLIDQRAFHDPWTQRVAAVGFHLLVVAYMSFLVGTRTWNTPNTVALGCLVVGFVLILVELGRSVRALIHPQPILRMDGAGMHLRRRDGSMGGIPWDGLRVSDEPRESKERARVLWQNGPAAANQKTQHLVGRYFWIFPKHIQESQGELQDALEMRDEFAPPAASALEATDASPPPDGASPPSLTTHRTIRDSQAKLAGPLIPLGYASMGLGYFMSRQGVLEGLLFAAFVGAALFLLVGHHIKRRRRERLVIDQGGVHTYDHARNWSLAWNQITAIAEITTTQGLEFLALFHNETPPPPAYANKISQGNGVSNPNRRLIPTLSLVPEAPGSGWCLIESSDLVGDHAEILAACRQGLSWAQGLNTKPPTAEGHG